LLIRLFRHNHEILSGYQLLIRELLDNHRVRTVIRQSSVTEADANFSYFRNCRKSAINGTVVLRRRLW